MKEILYKLNIRIIIYIAVLRALDLISTYLCLGNGKGYEANPFYSSIIYNAPLMILIMLGFFSYLFFGNWFFNKYLPKYSIYYTGILFIITTVSAYVVANNFFIYFYT